MSAAAKSPCDEAWIRSVRAGSPCARKSERWVLAATIIGSSMAFIDGTVVTLALPVLQQKFAAPVAGMQWVVESYALLLAALLLPGGALGDRHGRRRIFGAGTILFTLASIACGLAGGVGALVAARAVQGLGAALLVPTSLAIIGASFPHQRRGRAIGTWSAFTSIAMALGPVLGGWMVEHLSWRWIFFINVPLGAAVLGILRAHVPESRREDLAGDPVDWKGMLLVATGLGGVVYGLIASSELGFRHPAVMVGVAAGAALLAGFLVVEARSKSPMMPLGLFRSKAFAGVNALTALLYLALYGGFFFLPFNLQQAQGYSVTAAGMALLPFSVLLFLLSHWSGTLVDRFGPRLPLALGPLVAGIGFLLFALPGIGGTYWTTFFPAVAVLGLGMAITVAPLTATVLASAGDENTGVASGVNNAVSRIAGLLAVALLGVVMVDAFGASLGGRLRGFGIDEGIVRMLVSERAHLASLTPPDIAGESERAAIQRAIQEAFVDGFRRVMLIAALLAAASAVIGFLTAPGRDSSSAPAGPARSPRTRNPPTGSRARARSGAAPGPPGRGG